MKTRKLGMPYYPSNAYQVVQTQFKSFPEYIEYCRQLIAASRLDMAGDDREKIINANAPFELNANTASRKGVLLIHGLYDSPCQMRSVGEAYAAQGYHVRAMLLPGHGTVPGDLLKINYQDWIAAAEYSLGSFKGVVDELVIAGFSTGGTLAIYLALLYPALINKIVLFAPALRLIPLLNYLAQFSGQSTWALPAKDWLTIENEIDYAKYSSFCVNSLVQTYRLGNFVRKLLQEKSLRVPSLWFVTQHDEVLDSKALLKLFKRYATKESELIYYSPEPVKFKDPRIKWESSQRPDAQVVDFSHVCLPISPAHKHYGVEGDFPALIRAELAKKGREAKRYGSLRNINLFSRASLVRLTYNPDFEACIKAALRKSS